MMKKLYIAPEVELIEIRVESSVLTTLSGQSSTTQEQLNVSGWNNDEQNW